MPIRRCLTALLMPALLGSCALLNDPRSSFNAGQPNSG